METVHRLDIAAAPPLKIHYSDRMSVFCSPHANYVCSCVFAATGTTTMIMMIADQILYVLKATNWLKL